VRTARQNRGTQAEDDAAAYLEQAGWQVIGRNVRVGRDEIDILAVDPGPPPALVFVEVRSASSPAFGMPEERVDREKVGHLYRAARKLAVERQLSRRVDLVVVDRRNGRVVFRHLRALEPP
jgi:Predicted endonuclease distantly related to archaeal Holliday junction resolvase